MQMTFVKYRTKQLFGDSPRYRQWAEYAIVPTIWLSDLLEWLSNIEADVLKTTDNFDHALRLPITWPSYETCKCDIMVSDAIHCVL